MLSRIFKYKGNFPLENGGYLPGFQLRYSTWGKPNEDHSNVIWICHALTADSNPAEWWEGLVGEGKLYDPRKHFIICVNILGSCYGSTGPLDINPETKQLYFLDFPQVTIRDIVSSFDLLRQELGIKRIGTLIGGSLGGQQALEWSIIRPEVIDHLVLIATNAYHSPWGIAFNESQRLALKSDPTWRERRKDAGKAGMKAARSIALLSYRNYETYVKTQYETDINKIDHFKASSYQDYQGEKLVKRFNCHSYFILSKAMDSHHVGRERGSVNKALDKVQANTLVVGIKTDILFPVQEQKFLAENISGAAYREIDSFYGHDGFLVESKALKKIITDFYTSKTEKIPSK